MHYSLHKSSSGKYIVKKKDSGKYLHDNMRGYGAGQEIGGTFTEGKGGKPPDIHQSSDKWNKWAKEEGKKDTADYQEHVKSGGEKAYDVESSTTPGKTYRVWGEEGSKKCSCPGFKYRNTCKHVQAMGNEGPKRDLKYGRDYYYKNEEGKGAGGKKYPNDPPGYHEYVLKLEKKGLTTSDAQGVADSHFKKIKKGKGAGGDKDNEKSQKTISKYLYEEFRKRGHSPSEAREKALEEMRDSGKKWGKGAGGDKDDSDKKSIKIVDFQYGSVFKDMMKNITNEQKEKYKKLPSAKKMAILNSMNDKFLDKD